MTWPGIPTEFVRQAKPLSNGKVAEANTALRCVFCDAWTIAEGDSYNRVAYVHQGSYYEHTVCLPCWGCFPAVCGWFTSQQYVDNTDYRVWAVANLYDEYWGRPAKRYLERTKLDFRRAGHELTKGELS